MKRVALCVPTDLSNILKKYLTENDCEIIRDVPHISTVTILDFIQQKPDVIIVSEYAAIDKDLNLLQALHTIKAKINAQIIVHLGERAPGDRLISRLISMAIYDFIAAQKFNVSEILNFIKQPRNFNDVADYYLYFMDESNDPLPPVPQQYIEAKTKDLSEEKTSEPRLNIFNVFNKISKILPQKPKGVGTTKPNKRSVAHKDRPAMQTGTLEIEEPYSEEPTIQEPVISKKIEPVKWIPVIDIDESIIYLKDEAQVILLRFQVENVGLGLKEKEKKIKQLAAFIEVLPAEEYQLFSIERPVKLNNFLLNLQDKLKKEQNQIRKKLLQDYIRQASLIALSGEANEKIYCLAITERADGDTKVKNSLHKKAGYIKEKLQEIGLKTEIAKFEEIIEIYSLFANPLRASK